MKSSTSFVCEVCGYDTPAFMGKCPECGTWNSLKEIKVPTFQAKSSKLKVQSSEQSFEPKKLSEIKFEEKNRFSSGFSEMDSVLGGGIVPGSVVLLAGDPGVGKSTLLLQLALNITSQKTQNTQKSRNSDSQKLRQSDSPSFQSIPKSVLYISGEESEQQIKLRALRLAPSKGGQAGQANKRTDDGLLLSSLANTDAAVDIISDIKPNLVIVDSIQAMESENLTGLSGSVGQVRYAGMQLIRVAKSLGIPIIIVGHVTKEGMVAGPMVLSHMVDTVLFLEGEKFTSIRLLRSFKNRFGPVDEVGVFTMDERGMSEIKNPEEIFLSAKKIKEPGSVLTATLEGTRPFLVEIQALSVYSKLPYPRRVTSGIDSRRLELLLAVIQKHAKLPVDTQDIFVNVAGGMKLSDPASDLAICLAIYSSLKNITLTPVVAIAEVGLLGELRQVSMFSKRAKEAKKLGFTKILGADKVRTLREAISLISK